MPQDVSRTDSLLQAQQRVLESIVRGRPLPEILGALCRIVEEQAIRPVRAAILLVDPSGSRLVGGAAPSLPPEYSAALEGFPIDAMTGTCSAAAARRTPITTRDIASDPAWARWKELPLGHGL